VTYKKSDQTADTRPSGRPQGRVIHDDLHSREKLEQVIDFGRIWLKCSDQLRIGTFYTYPGFVSRASKLPSPPSTPSVGHLLELDHYVRVVITSSPPKNVDHRTFCTMRGIFTTGEFTNSAVFTYRSWVEPVEEGSSGDRPRVGTWRKKKGTPGRSRGRTRIGRPSVNSIGTSSGRKHRWSGEDQVLCPKVGSAWVWYLYLGKQTSLVVS